MADADPVAREVDCRVVYCGARGAGKTANLEYLHKALDPDTRGKLITPGRRGEGAYFFDFLTVADLREVYRQLRDSLRGEMDTAKDQIDTLYADLLARMGDKIEARKFGTVWQVNRASVLSYLKEMEERGDRRGPKKD